jgi:hypothetical protein
MGSRHFSGRPGTHPMIDGTDMELICTACFTHPIAAHHSVAHDSAEMLVCNLGAADMPEGNSGHDALRCNYCGSKVHLDHHHMAWYDT